MISAPLIGSNPLGIHQVLTDANTDYTIPLPDRATGCVIWFQSSESEDATFIGGRIGFDQDDAPVTGLTNEDDVMGYHPATPVQYEFGKPAYQGGGSNPDPRFIHVACATEGAVVRGTFLWAVDGTA